MEDIVYREEILEHYKTPLNFGKPDKFAISSRQTNPFCGDEIEMFVEFEEKSAGGATIPPQGWKIKTIGFEGVGCVISIVAGSMLTDYAKGKTKKELTKFSQEDMLDLLGIEVSETRKKCALLAFSVLKECLV
ncbi:MAG: hypothetical protein A3F31_03880 [Candidatus Levybacteria bacterium RIFCSPHIGHO2_12_FULL_38_12]|nr:MAG: hypothetical protein A2770_02270 [Candidatus Levybacteria bacterium RIFCSPHIGHO2_01_FULL_38_12]OGH21904.1 MAG: hypothetical protein A3D75_00490 [Candidatus Levybacteria bacterium RIFCSPHIGHO2_02_FULL_37_18]OGH22836.1 MAG: hypothetical protein A3F31_03880 [Candidatus Levybacteria bacterium RIFCSPHIGHO2_12_FULL_38_12]OGH33561.1 MAG: hypothetical protein A3A47_01835 [Candidatus Levybacteria bacterium RIFCSPLOWO2_01_FULL_37_20]OGH44482.1 MAG: hypothetical protein A3J14_03525 [Candidatus Lev